MIILIDNYESFTYNIFQYLKEITQQEIMVVRNDCIGPKGIDSSAASTESTAAA